MEPKWLASFDRGVGRKLYFSLNFAAHPDIQTLKHSDIPDELYDRQRHSDIQTFRHSYIHTFIIPCTVSQLSGLATNKRQTNKLTN